MKKDDLGVARRMAVACGSYAALIAGTLGVLHGCSASGESSGNDTPNQTDTTSAVQPSGGTNASTAAGSGSSSLMPTSASSASGATSTTSTQTTTSSVGTSVATRDDGSDSGTGHDNPSDTVETNSSQIPSTASSTDVSAITSGATGPTTDESATSAQTSSGAPPSDFFPCQGANPDDYDVVAVKEGSTWSVTRGAQEVYTGADFQQTLSSAYAALTSGRTSKESILVLGDGELGASIQLGIPSFTILNVCGTVDVTGTPSGSDRSPFYARNASNIDIPNLKLTGSPQYGLFFRQTNDVHLGQIELRLTREAGIGIRVDSGPNAGSTTDFNTNLTIDHVFGSGMGSHIVETYGIDRIEIGTVEGEDVGECGLLLNRSINAEVGSVTCTDCATGTGYAAFRVANSVGKVGNDFPDGNIHVGKVTARGGGRGIFSVSGCGGLVIDEIDIADTGNTSILMQNTYNTVIAAVSGIVSGGLVQLTNDTDNTNQGVYPPSKDVTLQNLTLTDGASVRQDWCDEYGSNGCSAVNISGGNVSMCD